MSINLKLFHVTLFDAYSRFMLTEIAEEKSLCLPIAITGATLIKTLSSFKKNVLNITINIPVAKNNNLINFETCFFLNRIMQVMNMRFQPELMLLTISRVKK